MQALTDTIAAQADTAWRQDANISSLNHLVAQHQHTIADMLATRKDPATIERFARERLHMAPPQPSAIRIVKAARPSPSTSPGNTPR